jgi:putative PIN family toxin of toxin-antitoxin system
VKVALDTNVLVSAVATRGLCADILQATLAEHDLVLSDVVFAELTRVLRRKMRVPAGTVRELEALLRSQATVIADAPALPLALRDASDLLVLAAALSGGADVLVTGDRDLLDIVAAAPIPILTPRGFWDLLRRPKR